MRIVESGVGSGVLMMSSTVIRDDSGLSEGSSPIRAQFRVPVGCSSGSIEYVVIGRYTCLKNVIAGIGKAMPSLLV